MGTVEFTKWWPELLAVTSLERTSISWTKFGM